MAGCRQIPLTSVVALALLVPMFHEPPRVHGDVEMDAAAQAAQIERYQAELERQRRRQEQRETRALGGERQEPPVPVATAGARRYRRRVHRNRTDRS